MSADIANTTLAAAPYYDDFDESKKFHRVLFRPSYPVQARELTQLQSILQNQIERFGDGVFKTGSIIKGCAPTVISDASYFAVPDEFDVSNPDYEYKIAYGTTTGVQARILKGVSGFVNTTSPPKFIVKYTSVGKNKATEFQQGETIEIYDAEQSYVGKYKLTVASATGFSVNDRIRGRTSDARGVITAINSNVISISDVRGDFLNNEAVELISNVSVFTIASSVAIDFTTATNTNGTPLATTSVVTTAQAGINYTPVGSAYALGLSEGVVYQKGFFIKTDPQILVLNSSAGGADAANNVLVGIETTETVITEFADSSLYDNSGNLSNDTAPGAHRLKLETNFVSYLKGSEPEEEIFFPIGEFGTNNILRWNTTSLSGRINDELAQRTYDESGHYTVKDFSVSTKPSANTEQFEYVIGDGKAYVRGNPIKFDTVQTLVARRGTDTESPVQQIVSMNYGSYVNAQEVRGYFPADTSVEVKLYDTFQNAVTTSKNSASAADGNLIGTANIRSVIFDDENNPQGSPNARYKFYLFNIKMNANKSFFDVKSVIYDAGRSFADVAVSDAFTTVSGVVIVDGGANYVTGDTVIIDGGDGIPAKLVVSATGGVVDALGIIDPGRYTTTPTELSTTPVTTSGGNGTGLQVSLSYDGEVESRLQESSYTPIVFGLSNRAVKSLKNQANTSDTKFYYNLTSDTALANTGTLSISISDGGSFFGFSDSTAASKRKIELVTTEALETVNLSGTVSATASKTLTGVSTKFDLDFVVGETIRFNNTNNVITAILSNTSLTLANTVTVSSNTYTRVHPAGSIISLDNSNRTITIDPGLQTLSVDLNASNTAVMYAWGSTKGIKATFYARKVNARPINKIVRRNRLVRFYNGSLTGTISTSGNVVTGTATTLDTDFKVGNYIRANGQTRKVTGITSNTQIQLETAFVSNLSANTFEIVHPFGFNLGVPDVFKINRISKTDTANDDVNSTASDIQKFFNVDFGQRDTHYDHAVLTPKPNIDLSNTHMLVDFDCFEANAAIGKGFFSVESYDIDDSLGANTSNYIRTWEIPTFYSQARQRDFDLRDAVDFRPYRANTAVLTSDPMATTMNPPTTTAFNSATTDYNPYPGQNFECNLTYYLPRRDALVLTSKGEFRVIEGEAKLQPRTPNADSETQMVIAAVYMPPYPSLTTLESQSIKIEPYAMKVSPTINKRFTMKDISAIEQRVSSLEYYTTLTRLEQKVTQLNIPNADGVDRFKNGIFVDPFDNHNLARINDSEHQIVIDSQLGVGRPQVSIENIKLELANNDYGNSLTVIRDSANNIAYNRNFLTVDYVPNTVFLEQSFATREIPIDSDDRFLFGTVDLDNEIFSDVEQFRNYPNREYGVAFDSYESNKNYTVELIYPTSRTIKLLARGLKPNARHYIGIDGVDYSYKATQGFIQLGNDEVAENIVVDGIEGQELYADSNGRLYAIITIPGNIGLGNHLLVVADVVASAISNGFCSSRALGSFVVNSVDDISDYPPEPKPPLPKTGLLVADFDVVGSLSVEEGQDHVLSFLDKTNRGVVAPDGSVVETPVSWQWTFVQCSTGCVDSSVAISTDPNPEDITFTYSSVIETVNVKLKVTGSGGTVSEIVKPIQLTKYATSQNFKLTIHNQLPGSDNDYYASAGSVLKATNYLHLNFKVERIKNSLPGGRCELTFSGNRTGEGSATDPNGRWTAVDVAPVETTNNRITSTGGLHVGLRWKGADVKDTTLEIQADYYNSADEIVESSTKYISWTKTGVLTPCKPCESSAFSEPVITPINRADSGTAQEINIRPIGDVLTYKVF